MAIEYGNTAWVLISTALVFIMTPAVGFFYGGLLGKKNMLSVLGQSIIIIGMVTLIWVTVGFSRASRSPMACDSPNACSASSWSPIS